MDRKKKRDTDVYDIVASNIKKYRKMANLTQEQLADKTLYTPEYIRRIEYPNGKKSFTIQSVHEISIALGVPMYKLFETKKESDD